MNKLRSFAAVVALTGSALLSGGASAEVLVIDFNVTDFDSLNPQTDEWGREKRSIPAVNETKLTETKYTSQNYLSRWEISYYYGWDIGHPNYYPTGVRGGDTAGFDLQVYKQGDSTKILFEDYLGFRTSTKDTTWNHYQRGRVDLEQSWLGFGGDNVVGLSELSDITQRYDPYLRCYTYVGTFADMGNLQSAHIVINYTPITNVPEPETYAMLLLGLGVVGAIAKRRRDAASA
jgi:hypothetical protein